MKVAPPHELPHVIDRNPLSEDRGYLRPLARGPTESGSRPWWKPWLAGSISLRRGRWRSLRRPSNARTASAQMARPTGFEPVTFAFGGQWFIFPLVSLRFLTFPYIAESTMESTFPLHLLAACGTLFDDW